MRFGNIIIFSIVALMSSPVTGSNTGYTITADSIYNHIAVLAHDSLEGRRVGTESELKAAQYIINIISELGLEPKGDSGTFLQPFPFGKTLSFVKANHQTIFGDSLDIKVSIYGITNDSNDVKYGDNSTPPEDSTQLDLEHYGPLIYKNFQDTGYNVVGYLPGKVDTTVIIGAHYDHLGWGGTGSGSRYHGKEPRIHNGANDNGSGSAALLELGRYFASQRGDMKYSLLFIAFSGEEYGLLGSSYFTHHMSIDSSKVRMMINIDMIGRMSEQKHGLAISGTGTCQAFKAYFDSLSPGDLKVTVINSGVGPSDFTSFYKCGIPVLNFFTVTDPDYNTPEDDIDKIDCEGIVQVANLVTELIVHFDQFDGSLTFHKTGDSKGIQKRNFSVTLGITPDFITKVEGLRIDGVSSDRPGEHAGLLEGDVIIKIGDTKVGNIYDYMNSLNKYRKGDSAEVIIIRQNDTLQLKVVFD
ncbi:MAG: peptidase M28 [Candidatus Zixiibacteriota bacterium]|nr:MAG: peptidase M28 [candidate division Zixibacteria bacterium]